MKASVVLFSIAAASSGAWAQTPGTTGNNNPISINNATRSNSSAASTSQGGAGGNARGGNAMANPNSSSGAMANPSASSGSSNVAIQTGNTTYPASQTVMTVPMVYTPSIATGNVCALGASGGGSWLGAGFAFGASWESMQCERRQTAALLWNMGTAESKAAAKEILCNSPEIRQAYAMIGAPCTVDLMRLPGPAKATVAAVEPVAPPVAFDPAPYRSAADCLTAAQAAGAALSLCAGKR